MFQPFIVSRIICINIHNNINSKTQENLRGQRETIRALAVICHSIFILWKSVFRDVRTDYNLDLRFLVKLKKQFSMIMADLS